MKVSELIAELQKFPGLHDAEGVPIFEGDIVEVGDNWEHPSVTYPVKWQGHHSFLLRIGFRFGSIMRTTTPLRSSATSMNTVNC